MRAREREVERESFSMAFWSGSLGKFATHVSLTAYNLACEQVEGSQKSVRHSDSVTLQGNVKVLLTEVVILSHYTGEGMMTVPFRVTPAPWLMPD